MRKEARILPNERLRQERQRRGWSREYVAEQVGIADPKTIGRWERGVAFPSSHFRQRLCILFDKLAEDLGLFQEGNSALENPTSEEATGAAIGSRRMLLVIDDAWKIEDAQAFKIGGPNCAYLLATRIPFANDGAIAVRELNFSEEASLAVFHLKRAAQAVYLLDDSAHLERMLAHLEEMIYSSVEATHS